VAQWRSRQAPPARRGGGLGDAVLAAVERAPDDDDRQRVGAMAEQPQRGLLGRAVATQVAGGLQALLEP
jgi:hypothetical protein